MTDLIGKKVSHYKILAKIGQGGMGVVYKAEDTKLQRTVALKRLLPEMMGTERDQERFLREARAAASLDHPNICTVHEIDEVDGIKFMAMASSMAKACGARFRKDPLKSPRPSKLQSRLHRDCSKLMRMAWSIAT